MTKGNNCSNEKEHRGHIWLTTETTECSGQAACGDMSHPPHSFEKTVTRWCSGICLCGIIETTHGPGEHK